MVAVRVIDIPQSAYIVVQFQSGNGPDAPASADSGGGQGPSGQLHDGRTWVFLLLFCFCFLRVWNA